MAAYSDPPLTDLSNMKALFLLLTGFILVGKPSLQAHPSFTGCIKTLPSNLSDYFRSVATGDWGSVSTWESSPDNATWSAATLTPTSLANTISIRNGHTVTVSSNQDMDQVIIAGGGILFHSANTLTVNDGTGDDIIIQSGGIFTLASNNNEPQFSGTATVNINTGGILRLSATGLTNAGTGVHAANYVYQNASVLEYTLNLAFSSNNVIFFPNADAVTIPIFRTTSNLGLIGANNPTVINGLYEANGTITFDNSGTKTFRNGIIGTGNISSVAGSGKFVIDGATANLGGTGSLTLPTAGMEIGVSTTVTMVSDKAITGNIALLSNALVILGTHNLSMTGDISGGSATSHVVTNSTGKLVLNNITGVPRIFPIGGNTTTIDPLAIYNGSNLNYGARVEIGINPSIRYPIAAVNRTWVVNPSGVPAGAVNVNFFYSNGHGNALFNYTTAVEQGFYTGVWNVINTGLVQAGSYQVATTVSSFAANTDAPMVLGNIPAILEVNNSVQLAAQKQNDKVMLNWTATLLSNTDRFIAERSADGRTFTSLAELPAGSFSFTDMQLFPGLNYYRIQVLEKDGRRTYSNMVVLLNAAKGAELVSILPNPVTTGHFKLNISAAQKVLAEIVITDVQGRLIHKQTASLAGGYNQITMQENNFSPGIYFVYSVIEGERSKLLRFVVQ
ncbi:MAG: T9SS type A sorting domain-containing protein [Chitinophagaceae bacterium]|nr:T9SS type A sorting domain-containing protein [Chitinophagaceae bacterium]